MTASKLGIRGPVIITGGSRGIGAAVAHHCAMAGFSVGIFYRSDEHSAQTVCKAVTDLGQKALAVKADVTDEGAIVGAFEEISNRLGAPYGLVNNAGVNGGRIAIADFEWGQLEHVWRVNVMGTLLCTREAVRRMAHSRGGQGGVIVNVSSMAASIGGRPGLSHYAASKSAVDAFTVGAARELAPEGIRVFAIRPGATKTDLTREGYQSSEVRSGIEGTIAMRRYAEPDEIDIPVFSILADSFSFLSGAVIDAAGGGYVFA